MKPVNQKERISLNGWIRKDRRLIKLAEEWRDRREGEWRKAGEMGDR